MNRFQNIAFTAGAIAAIIWSSSCNSGGMRKNPGRTYAPDMTYSQAYESYTYNPNFADGLTNRTPVEGTVPTSGDLPDHIKEGDTAVYALRSIDRKFTEAEIEHGKRLFNIQCAVCHGTNLDGQGPLYTSTKFAAMPANLKDAKYLSMSIGQMYYAIKYGKGMMGSYAPSLSIKERWEVIAYIKKVQSENGGAPFTMGAEATEVTATASVPSTDSTQAH